MAKINLTRRLALAGAAAATAGRALAQQTGAETGAQAGAASAQDQPPSAPPSLGRTVRVDLDTGQGRIVLALYPDRAPVTVANFLRYVRGRRFDGASVYRAVRSPYTAPAAPQTGFIQGGVQNDPKRVLAPIAHEPTTQTGLHHKDGTITMARSKPGSATGDFVIMVGDASYMDANPAAPNPPGGDNLGYAAFGQVVEGMDVVRAILALPTGGHARNPVMQGQILDPPVKIASARMEG